MSTTSETSMLGEVESVVSQVAGSISSAAEPITAVAGAVQDVAKDLQPLINPSLEQRINQLKNGAEDDVTKFKNLLLASDVDGLQLMLFELPSGVGLSVSEAERDQLGKISCTISGWNTLGSYSVSRNSKLLADIAQLEALNGK